MKKADAPVIQTEEPEAPVAVPNRRASRVGAVALPENIDLNDEIFHNATDTPLHGDDTTPNADEVTVLPTPIVLVPPPLPPEIPPHVPIPPPSPSSHTPVDPLPTLPSPLSTDHGHYWYKYDHLITIRSIDLYKCGDLVFVQAIV